MAATSQGAQLTEQHRLAQQQVRADFLAEYLALWVLLDSARLDETGPGWVRAVMPLIQRYRLQSAETAAQYFARFSAVEAPTTPTPARIERPQIELPPGVQRPTPTPPRPSPAPRREASRVPDVPSPRRQPVRTPEPERSPKAPSSSEPRVAHRDRKVRWNLDETLFERRPEGERRTRVDIPDIDWGPSDRAAKVSLEVTGPVGQKSKAKRGKPLQKARDESLAESSGAASRHVLTGGRQSLLRLAQEDMQVKGWVRVTDGDPCAFCAMLASRGVVFKERSFSRSDPRWHGPGTVKVHDNCACTLEVVYRTDAALPGRAAEFQKMWNDNIRGRYSGRSALNAWRRLYEQQQRDARRNVA